MFEDELRDILRDLVRSTRASGATIVGAEGDGLSPPAAGDANAADRVEGADAQASSSPAPALAPVDPPATPTIDGTHCAPLGRGATLQLHQPSDQHDSVPAALERAARAIRACARRWNRNDVPAAHYSAGGPVKRDRVVDRVQRYLQAFANTAGVRNAIVTVAGELSASAAPPTELQAERLPFLLKQLANEVRRHRGETSHVELIQPDVVLFAFWIDACLLVFVSDDYAEDFVRHRAKMVMRELTHLLPYLDDDDPDGGARVAPLPTPPAD